MLYIIVWKTVPKLCVVAAFPPDGGYGRTMMVSAAPDRRGPHVVLLPVRRFLLHAAPDTEHRASIVRHFSPLGRDVNV